MEPLAIKSLMALLANDPLIRHLPYACPTNHPTVRMLLRSHGSSSFLWIPSEEEAYSVSGEKSALDRAPSSPPASFRVYPSNLRSKSPLFKKYYRSFAFQFVPSITMANADILKIEDKHKFHHFSIFDLPAGEGVKFRGQLIERKIEDLEKLAYKVSNRRSRRWLNDRLLIELVPRLKVEEIRGLFAPPPWGESTPLSVFCMTNVEEWDVFRNIDMDKEASLIGALEKAPSSRKETEKDKLVALNAWHRVDFRSREAFRHKLLSELVENYEEQIRGFIKDRSDEDVLKLHVQNPFHRLLLHGVCEYYNLISATVTKKNSNLLKVTKIRKKILFKEEALPAISLSQFLKISKNGFL